MTDSQRQANQQQQPLSANAKDAHFEKRIEVRGPLTLLAFLTHPKLISGNSPFNQQPDFAPRPSDGTIDQPVSAGRV